MGIVNTEIKQKTIKKAVSLVGVGLHTGKNVTLTFKPALANTGLAFKRVDLEGMPVIEADASYVTNTQRGTCLEKNGVTIQTSEHVLAALVGMDVDNVILELNYYPIFPFKTIFSLVPEGVELSIYLISYSSPM